MGEDSCSNVESVDRNLEHVDNLKGSISLSFFLDGIQIAFSCILLLFSVALVAAAILPDKTSAWSTFRVPGGGSLVLFWLLVIWLAIVEGGQGALVGLMPVAKDKYRTTHRIAYTCTSVVHKDRSLDRSIVGRQFLVVLIIFLVNICGGFVAKGSHFRPSGHSAINISGKWFSNDVYNFECRAVGCSTEFCRSYVGFYH